MIAYLRTWAGLVVLVLFFLAFFMHSLPNNRPLTRLDVWESLPFIYLNLVDPIQEEGVIPSGWSYFPQRLPMLAVAGLILAGCWSLGRWVLRGVDFIFQTPCLLTRLERELVGITLGLSVWSLITLGLGLAGALWQGLFIALLAGFFATDVFWRWKQRDLSLATFMPAWSRLTGWQATILLTLAPFLLAILLGSLLPESDFDVKEYHLQGPKEFFQQEAITMLPHNVYTSFPFLTEMLSLSSMVIYGDWYWGALAGKCVLASFAIWTGLAVFALADRLFGNLAAWMSLLFYLTTPWTYRISIIAYTEGGLSCYLAITLLLAVVTTMNARRGDNLTRLALVCGMLAGAAVSCKYPGMVQVVIPIGLWLTTLMTWRQLTVRVRQGFTDAPIELPLPSAVDTTSGQASRTTGRESTTEEEAGSNAHAWHGATVIACYALGVLLTFGPWMAKNILETGNPVYPLLYSAFGGEDWSPELDAKWKNSHYPHSHTPESFLFFLKDIPLVNDWQSVLVYGFALLTLAWVRERPSVRWLWIYLAFLFLAWWGLTHRLDRFWVPMQPVACVLAGGFWALMPVNQRPWYVPFVVFGVIYNLGFITSGLSGDNSYLYELTAMRDSSGRLTAPEVMAVNELTSGKVLCVGEAEVFDATFQPVYNTVFDVSIFEEWTALPDDALLPSGEKRMRPAYQIRKILSANQIEFVLVNWSEILRYRTSYRYTDYVTPQRFQTLVENGVLKPPLGGYPFFRAMESYSDTERIEIETWAPELVVTIQGQRYFVTAQIYPVVKPPGS